jgi:translation initiation factor IF-2
MIKQKLGEAIVRKVFDIKGLGVIAGCYVKEGRITRECSVVIWRGREKIGQGKIRSLQRDKKSVKEVHTGFECGFIVDSFTDWQEDDRVECFIEVPKV